MKVEGRNPVIELLKTDKTIDKILIQEKAVESGSGKLIFAMIKEKNINYKIMPKDIINKESETQNHQGFIAFTEDFKYTDLNDMIDSAVSNSESPLIVVLDDIEDPQNLGSIIRACECGGVEGVIIPKNRSAQVNETVVRVSSGASSYVKIARETNLINAINQLKNQGFWVYGSDSNGESMYDGNFNGKIALVIGSEGKGMRRLTRENCDKIVSIPMYGKVNSLNASVATGVLIYEINRQRFK